MLIPLLKEACIRRNARIIKNKDRRSCSIRNGQKEREAEKSKTAHWVESSQLEMPNWVSGVSSIA